MATDHAVLFIPNAPISHQQTNYVVKQYYQLAGNATYWPVIYPDQWQALKVEEQAHAMQQAKWVLESDNPFNGTLQTHHGALCQRVDYANDAHYFQLHTLMRPSALSKHPEISVYLSKEWGWHDQHIGPWAPYASAHDKFENTQIWQQKWAENTAFMKLFHNQYLAAILSLKR